MHMKYCDVGFDVNHVKYVIWGGLLKGTHSLFFHNHPGDRYVCKCVTFHTSEEKLACLCISNDV